MSKRSANGSQQFLAGEVPEFIIPLIPSPLVLTAALLADGFLLANTSYMWKFDLAGMNQVKLTGRVTTVSASASSPKIQLRYSPIFTTAPASILQLGATSVEMSIFTGTTAAIQDSGWIDLAPGARIDGAHLMLMSIGGDGVISPAVNSVIAQFR